VTVSDPLTLDAGAVERLAPAEARDVLAAWVRAGLAELPRALAASRSSEHARLARKALYQLRSSGVAVEPPPPAAPGPAPRPAAEPDLPALFSAVVGTGERAVVFARPVRGGGVTSYQGVLSDEAGVLQLEATSTSRGEYRRRLEELRRAPELAVQEVGWAQVREALAHAWWQSDRASPPPPPAVVDLLRRLELAPADPEAEPLPAPAPDDGPLLALAAGLGEVSELGAWRPSAGALAELGEALERLASSPLALDETQRQVRVADQVARLAAGYLTPARRRRYARRLWTMADFLEGTGRERWAEIARAEARSLFHAGARSAFVEAMFLAAAASHRPAG
jgi:hypothetical protein